MSYKWELQLPALGGLGVDLVVDGNLVGWVGEHVDLRYTKNKYFVYCRCCQEWHSLGSVPTEEQGKELLIKHIAMELLK